MTAVVLSKVDVALGFPPARYGNKKGFPSKGTLVSGEYVVVPSATPCLSPVELRSRQ